jgi:hypothetical protein
MMRLKRSGMKWLIGNQETDHLDPGSSHIFCAGISYVRLIPVLMNYLTQLAGYITMSGSMADVRWSMAEKASTKPAEKLFPS